MTRIDELIIRVLQGHADPRDIARLQAWRSASPENEAHYRDLSEIWAEVPDHDIETIAPSPSAIRERAEAPPTIHLDSRRRPSRGWMIWLATAASLTFLVLSGSLLLRSRDSDGPVLQIQQLATGAGETLMTQLSDGTAVYLAPNSTLQVSPTPGVREVRLDGRAFFGVAKHGADWPFIIRSAHGEVHVLGTRFEFSTVDDEVRVVVVDGSVDFSTERDNVQLGAGQMSLVLPDSDAIVQELEDVHSVLGWMGRSLIFQDTPLPRAAREIERTYGSVVEVHENISHQTISGGFKDRSFREVVAVICRVTSADCVIGDDHAVISAGTP